MISIVYCTREHNQNHIDHLKKTAGHPKVEVIEYINQGESLTKFYNKGLKESKYDIVVFLHDDIIIETRQWAKKLAKLYDNNPEYGILGVAGTKFLAESGQWWADKSKMYGRVAHTHEGKSWLSSYSDDLVNRIEDVVVVDGVFFSVMKSKLKVHFDETVEGFHFYEIDFCFQNYLRDVKLGVHTKIRINHQSIGMTNDEWEKNRALFAEKYKDELPVKIRREFDGTERFKILIATEDIEKTIGVAAELVKLRHSVTITSTFDDKTYLKLKQKKIKFFPITEPLGYKMGDGVWQIQTPNGSQPSEDKKLYKINNVDFDVMHVDGVAEVKEYIQRFYPEIPYADITSDVEVDYILEEYKRILA